MSNDSVITFFFVFPYTFLVISKNIIKHPSGSPILKPTELNYTYEDLGSHVEFRISITVFQENVIFTAVEEGSRKQMALFAVFLFGKSQMISGNLSSASILTTSTNCNRPEIKLFCTISLVRNSRKKCILKENNYLPWDEGFWIDHNDFFSHTIILCYLLSFFFSS